MPISCQFVAFLAKPIQGIPLIATSTLTSNVETRFSMSSQMAMISIAWIGRFICKNTKTWRDTEADLGKLGLCSGSTDLLGHNGWWLILWQKCAPRSCDILQSNQSLEPTPSIIPMLLLPYFSTLIFPISCRSGLQDFHLYFFNFARLFNAPEAFQEGWSSQDQQGVAGGQKDWKAHQTRLSWPGWRPAGPADMRRVVTLNSLRFLSRYFCTYIYIYI